MRARANVLAGFAAWIFYRALIRSRGESAGRLDEMARAGWIRPAGSGETAPPPFAQWGRMHLFRSRVFIVPPGVGRGRGRGFGRPRVENGGRNFDNTSTTSESKRQARFVDAARDALPPFGFLIKRIGKWNTAMWNTEHAYARQADARLGWVHNCFMRIESSSRTTRARSPLDASR